MSVSVHEVVCSWDCPQNHCDPDQAKALTEDEWIQIMDAYVQEQESEATLDIASSQLFKLKTGKWAGFFYLFILFSIISCPGFGESVPSVTSDFLF